MLSSLLMALSSQRDASPHRAQLVPRTFLLDKAPNVQFALHRDRDYMNDDAAAKIEGAIKDMGAHDFIASRAM